MAINTQQTSNKQQDTVAAAPAAPDVVTPETLGQVDAPVVADTTKVETTVATTTIEAPKVEAPKAPEVVVPPVVKPAMPVEPPKVQNTELKVDNNSFEAKVAKIKETGTAQEIGLVAALEKYVSNMKPGMPVTPDRGAEHQYSLWRAIHDTVLNSSNENFRKLWNIVLMFFAHYNKGVFDIRYVFRFTHMWQWSEEELRMFEKIINLIRLTADPATRAQGLKSVDMNKALDGIWGEEARQRITMFYTV